MSLKTKIYNALPVSFQNIACSIEGLRIIRERYGGNFYQLLREAESRTKWSNEEIVAYRNNRLKQFLKHCQDNIPFYRDYFRINNLDYRDINSLEDLTSLPIITKRDINENPALFTNNKLSRRKVVTMHTSGSTGSPLHFYTTKDAIRELWSIFWRYRRWHGIDFNTWGAYLVGRAVVPIENKKSPFWRVNIPGKQFLMSGLHLNRGTSIHYLHELKKRRIKWIYGYPSLIALLAQYKIAENYDLDYPVKWITVNSENLLPDQKNLIEKAFGVKPIQLYGMAEAVANFSECPEGSLHVDEDLSAVEFIKLDNIDGYKVVGTNYSNFATGFVRYEVNDVCKLSDNHCLCGRPGRIITSIEGREGDYIVVRDGNAFTRISSMMLYRPFTNSKNIIEGQVIQKNINELIIRIVKNNNFTNEDENQFIQSMKERTRGLIDLNIQYTDKIQRSTNGKLNFVVSEIKEIPTK